MLDLLKDVISFGGVFEQTTLSTSPSTPIGQQTGKESLMANSNIMVGLPKQRSQLALGSKLIKLAPVPAALDIILVGTETTNLLSWVSGFLWGVSFGLGIF